MQPWLSDWGAGVVEPLRARDGGQQHARARRDGRGIRAGGVDGVRMPGHLSGRDRNIFKAKLLTDETVGQPRPLPLANGQLALQRGQREGGLTIAAIRGAEQTEQRLVIGNVERLALAEQPPDRRVVAGEQADFANVRLCHALSPSRVTGRYPSAR